MTGWMDEKTSEAQGEKMLGEWQIICPLKLTVVTARVCRVGDRASQSQIPSFLPHQDKVRKFVSTSKKRILPYK
jgi:hypothetical protein